MDLAKLGTTIRLERQRLGITQQSLAELAGISKGRIEALENGRSQDMGFNTVICVMKTLGFSITLQKA